MSRFDENANALVHETRDEVAELKAQIAMLEARLAVAEADEERACAEARVSRAEALRASRLRDEIVIALHMQQDPDPSQTLRNAAAKINALMDVATEADLKRWADGQVPVEPYEWGCDGNTYKTLIDIAEGGGFYMLTPIGVQPMWYGQGRTLVIVPCEDDEDSYHLELFGSDEEAEKFCAGASPKIRELAEAANGERDE